MIRLFPYSLRQAGVISLLAGLIVGGVAAIDAPRAGNDPPVLVSVNRTNVNRINKGDRLPLAPTLTARSNSSSSTIRLSPKGPPLGCDPLFSPIADPIKVRLYYRRCTV